MKPDMKILIGLMCVLIVLIAGYMLAGTKYNKPNFEYLPDMAYSCAVQTQAENPFYKNHKPIAGAIARKEKPLHFGSSEEEGKRAGRQLDNPLKNDKLKDLQRGQVIYQRFCTVCHGAGGRGNGPASLRGFPRPPSLLLETAVNKPDGQIFHIITYGFKNMPAYGAQIGRPDRWQVVNYLRKLQESSQ